MYVVLVYLVSNQFWFQGVITTSGFPATHMNKGLINIPNIAPYGIYKFRLDITNKKNENVGCFYTIVEVVRPKEKPWYICFHMDNNTHYNMKNHVFITNYYK